MSIITRIVAILAGVGLLLTIDVTSVAAAWAPAGPLPGLGSGRVWSLAISPATPAVAVAATDNGIYRSADAGKSWAPVALPRRRVWAIGFELRNANVVYAGTAGLGIQRSTDAGATWADVPGGPPSRTIRSLAFGLDGLAAGTDDGVAISADGTRWTGGGPGDQLHGYSISSVAIAANTPQFTVIAGADSGAIGKGSLFRSTAAGTWEVLQAGLPNNAVVSAVAAGPISQAVTRRPLVVNTNKGTFHSGDSGTSWTESSGIPKDPAPTLLTTSVFSPTDPLVAYGAADSGGAEGGALMRSTDGGSSFAAASTGLPDRSRNVTSIAISSTSPPDLLAAIDQPSGGSIFHETDQSVPTAPSLVPEGTAAVTPPKPAPTTPPQTSNGSNHASTPPPAPPGAVSRFASSAFHWPSPLIFEILLVLVIGFAIHRWREKYLKVEGPP